MGVLQAVARTDFADVDIDFLHGRLLRRNERFYPAPEGWGAPRRFSKYPTAAPATAPANARSSMTASDADQLPARSATSATSIGPKNWPNIAPCMIMPCVVPM